MYSREFGEGIRSEGNLRDYMRSSPPPEQKGGEQSLCFKINPVKFNKVENINDFTTEFTMENILYEIDEKKTYDDSNNPSIILTSQRINLHIMSLANSNVDYENSTSYTGTKEEKGKYTSFVLF